MRIVDASRLFARCLHLRHSRFSSSSGFRMWPICCCTEACLLASGIFITYPLSVSSLSYPNSAHLIVRCMCVRKDPIALSDFIVGSMRFSVSPGHSVQL